MCYNIIILLLATGRCKKMFSSWPSRLFYNTGRVSLFCKNNIVEDLTFARGAT